jgi:hypothetical protein
VYRGKFAYTELQTPLPNVLGHDGSPGRPVPRPQRAEVRLYTAAVLRQVPEEPLQPVPMGEVHLAADDDVAAALRMDAYLKEGARTAVPVGLYRSGGTESPVYLDADFLLGPRPRTSTSPASRGWRPRRAPWSGCSPASSRTSRRRRGASRPCAST